MAACQPTPDQLHDWAIGDDEGILEQLVRFVGLRPNAASALCRTLGMDLRHVFIRTLCAVEEDDFEAALTIAKYSEPSDGDAMHDMSLTDKSRARALMKIARAVFPPSCPASP